MKKTWYRPTSVENVWATTWKREFEETMGNVERRAATVKRLQAEALYLKIKKYVTPGQLVLEGGCGLGQWVYLLSGEGYRTVGVEYSDWAVEKIKAVVPSLDVRQGDVSQLDFQDNYFDGYMSFGVAEHFQDGPGEVLKEAVRVLKPGGILFLSFPYMNMVRKIAQPFVFFKETMAARRDGWEFYQYAYPAGEMKKYLSESGFEIIEEQPFSPLPFLIRSSLLRYVFNIFYRKLRGKQLTTGKLNIDNQVRPVGGASVQMPGLEKRMRRILDHPIVTMFFSHELLLVARKK